MLVLRQGDYLSLLAGAKSKWWLAGDRERADELYAQGQLHFGKAFGLSSQVSRHHFNDHYETEWTLGWHVYF